MYVYSSALSRNKIGGKLSASTRKGHHVHRREHGSGLGMLLEEPRVCIRVCHRRVFSYLSRCGDQKSAGTALGTSHVTSSPSRFHRKKRNKPTTPHSHPPSLIRFCWANAFVGASLASTTNGREGDRVWATR